VLQPGVPRGLVIQSWRGRKSVAEAARLGHRVILSNGYYLDLLQPAASHYLVDPLGEEAGRLPAEAQARVLGGEACMWMEFVGPENVDARTWPRAAAVAERFWSPAEVRDVASMYRRMEDVSRRLEWLGLTHRASPRLMFVRMAGTAEIGPLETLAEAVEPVKNYNRAPAREYYVTHALNRFVDAAPAESEAAREFGVLVERAVAGDAAARRGVRERLAAWRGNDARLRPLAERSALVKEVGPVSEALAAVAQAGLEALDAIEAGKKVAVEWRARQAELTRTAGLAPLGASESAWCREFVGRRTPATAAAKQCAAPRHVAQLLIVVAPHVRKLVEAAPGR
jgi:hexosaminidase